MLDIIYNRQVITRNVNRGSVKITEQLNNRANTASFSVTDEKIVEGSPVEIWEYCVLREAAVIGDTVLQVDDTFSISNKFIPWNVAFLSFDVEDKTRVFIESVDHEARTVTITEPLVAGFNPSTKFGNLCFAGIVQNAPETELTLWQCDPILEQQVNVGDFKQLFDRKLVVETYKEMYFREILGRIVYKFCANDSETTLFNFETLGTSTGIVGTQSFDIDDRIQGNKAIKFRFTAAGTGAATYTFAAVDISQHEKGRFRWKIAADNGDCMDMFKIRIGQDTSNYFERSIEKIGLDYEAHRSLESILLKEPHAVVGTPVLSAVTFLQYYFEANDSTVTNSIHVDIFQAFDGGFTLQNTNRGNTVYSDVHVEYKKPSAAIENFTKLTGDYWYIDYERDIHFYGKLGETVAPFELSDTSQNYGDMKIDIDITSLKNRQSVLGGEAIDENVYIQDEVTDGFKTSWTLDYKPKYLHIFVDTVGDWLHFVEKTVGVENLVDETGYDFVYNFQEKVVRATSVTALLPAGTIFRREYNPYRSIRVRMTAADSVLRMRALTGGDGIYDGTVIIEPKIETFQEARLRALAELNIYKNAIFTVTLQTNYDGLKPGQLLTVIDTARGINEKLLIQKVSWNSKSLSYRSYSVTASTTLFGITEFLQLLLKKSSKFDIDESDIVNVIVNIDEVITLQDAYVFEKKSSIFRAGTIDDRRRDFKNQRFTNAFDYGLNKQKFMGGWYQQNYGANSYVSSTAGFETPLVQMQVLDGKPWDWKPKRLLVSREFSTNKIYNGCAAVDDKNGNTQTAVEFVENGRIALPYNGLTATPEELTVFFEHFPKGTVSGTDYTLFSWAGIVISANQSKIKVSPDYLGHVYEFVRSKTTRERVAVKIKYGDYLELWLDGKLVLTQALTGISAVTNDYWPGTNGRIGSLYPNMVNKFYRGVVAEIQVYGTLISQRNIRERTLGYTDRAGLTLVNRSSVALDKVNAAWTFAKVKPSTQYQIAVQSEIVEELTNTTGSNGLSVKIRGYQEHRIGEEAGRATGKTFETVIVPVTNTVQDWTRTAATFTTTADTERLNIEAMLENANGVARFNELRLIEIATEMVANVARAGYAVCG